MNQLTVRRASAVGRRQDIVGRKHFDRREDRDRAIIAMAMARICPARIEERIEASRAVICAVLKRARARGEAVPSFGTQGRVKGAPPPIAVVTIPTALLEQFARPARLRGITPADVAVRILEAVAEAGTVEAVLQEGG